MAFYSCVGVTGVIAENGCSVRYLRHAANERHADTRILATRRILEPQEYVMAVARHELGKTFSDTLLLHVDE